MGAAASLGTAHPTGTPHDEATAPKVTHGPIFGKLCHDSVLIWFRGERAGQVLVEIEDKPLSEERASRGLLLEFESAHDFAAKLLLSELSANTRYYVRCGGKSGSFCTCPAPMSREGCKFAFGSCIGGQGYGRLEDKGYPIFNTIAALEPDLFVLTGDIIYADDAIELVSTQSWNEGRRHQGDADEPKATDLEGFRRRYRYTLEDAPLASLLASTPLIATWDDHEIFDNWGIAKLKSEGKEQLLRDGVRAYFEYLPVCGPSDERNRIYRKECWGAHVEIFVLDTRSYRAVHATADGEDCTPYMDTMLGETQLQWLLDGLQSSTCTWKFLVSSVPLTYNTGYPQPEVDGFDGWSDAGAAKELRRIMGHIHKHKVINVIFITGDVHFPFALSYDPYQQGHPLTYEIASSPLSALCLAPPPPGKEGGEHGAPPPSAADLHPKVLHASGSFAGDNTNFGYVEVATNGELRVSLKGADGQELWAEQLVPMPCHEPRKSEAQVAYDHRVEESDEQGPRGEHSDAQLAFLKRHHEECEIARQCASEATSERGPVDAEKGSNEPDHQQQQQAAEPPASPRP